MHPCRAGANRREALQLRYQLRVPSDQLDRGALLNLVSKRICLYNDQATPYLIDL